MLSLSLKIWRALLSLLLCLVRMPSMRIRRTSASYVALKMMNLKGRLRYQLQFCTVIIMQRNEFCTCIMHSVTQFFGYTCSFNVSYLLAFLYVCVFVLGFDVYISLRVSRNISRLTIACGITSTSTFTCRKWNLVITTLWRNMSMTRCCGRKNVCLLMRSIKYFLMQCPFEFVLLIVSMHWEQVYENKTSILQNDLFHH